MDPEDDIEVAGRSEQGGVEEEAETSRHHPAINVMSSLGKLLGSLFEVLLKI